MVPGPCSWDRHIHWKKELAPPSYARCSLLQTQHEQATILGPFSTRSSRAVELSLIGYLYLHFILPLPPPSALTRDSVSFLTQPWRDRCAVPPAPSDCQSQSLSHLSPHRDPNSFPFPRRPEIGQPPCDGCLSPTKPISRAIVQLSGSSGVELGQGGLEKPRDQHEVGDGYLCLLPVLVLVLVLVFLVLVRGPGLDLRSLALVVSRCAAMYFPVTVGNWDFRPEVCQSIILCPFPALWPGRILSTIIPLDIQPPRSNRPSAFAFSSRSYCTLICNRRTMGLSFEPVPLSPAIRSGITLSPLSPLISSITSPFLPD